MVPSARSRPSVGLPIRQQSVGRATEQILVQEGRDPDRDAEDTLGNHTRGFWGGDDAGVRPTVTRGPIPMAANDPTVGPNLDFQDGGILCTPQGGKRAATTLAAALRLGKFVLLADGGQVCVVAAAWSGPATLLTPRPPRRAVGRRGHRGRCGGGAGLYLAAEELLFAETQLGAELFVLLPQQGFALEGALVHGLPVAGGSPGLEFLGEAWTHRTRAIGQGRSGATRGRRGSQQRHPRRVKGDSGTRLDGHDDRCSPPQPADQTS
jgi:hypothetical protein